MTAHPPTQEAPEHDSAKTVCKRHVRKQTRFYEDKDVTVNPFPDRSRLSCCWCQGYIC
ncbi:hypothetical protein IF2G_08858 [Cordyceps javanica]|nr:hypothetical protein IF2G_08858 [Cordyceps javanica]